MGTGGHDGARGDYPDYATAPRNWHLRPRRSLRAVSKPSDLKVVKTPELTYETVLCLDTARQSIRMDMNTGETPNHSNKAKAVQPVKLTQFATEHRICTWE